MSAQALEAKLEVESKAFQQIQKGSGFSCIILGDLRRIQTKMYLARSH
jgi:hypothetical protein